MKHEYLRDRAMRKGRDGRNPYGSRGGYVSSRRGGRDRNEMDYRESARGYDSRYDRERRGEDYRYYDERPRESYRPMEYELYGKGEMRRVDSRYDDYERDYARGRRDYSYYDYAEEDMEKEWEEDLKEWCEKLKKYDLFGLPKEEIIRLAKEMNVKFEDYDEKEFTATYYMLMSDYPSMGSSPQHYIAMAKEWLEDSDVMRKGGEKLCTYYYEIVKGGK